MWMTAVPSQWRSGYNRTLSLKWHKNKNDPRVVLTAKITVKNEALVRGKFIDLNTSIIKEKCKINEFSFHIRTVNNKEQIKPS